MKKDQIFVAIIIGFMAALMFTSAQADDWTNKGNVYHDGVSVGTMYDVKVATGMPSEQAIQEVKDYYAQMEIQRKKERDQEQRQKRKAAEVEAKFQKEVGEILALLPEDVTPIYADTVNAFFDTHEPEIKTKYGPILQNIKTIDDVRVFFNSAYGTDLSNSQIQELIEYGETLTPEEEAAYISGATTCAIKLLEGKGPCGAGTGTGA